MSFVIENSNLIYSSLKVCLKLFMAYVYEVYLQYAIETNSRAESQQTPSVEKHVHQVVGEPKSRILQNDKKIAPDFDMAEFLHIGSLISA